MTVEEREEIYEHLEEFHKTLLIELYYKRCLTLKLIQEYIIKVPLEEVEEEIGIMSDFDLIEKVIYKKDKVSYFLSSEGTTFAKYLISLDSRRRKSDIDKNYKSLTLNPLLIHHQLILNDFSYQMSTWAVDNEIPHTYCDQIYAPQLSKTMMTDGLFFLEYDIFLLEADTGSEIITDLKKKWTNYFNFLNKPNEFYKNKRFTVMFILGEMKNPHSRRISVLASLNEFICSKFGQNFEILIGSPSELMLVLTEKYVSDVEKTQKTLRVKHGFTINASVFPLFGGQTFDDYVYLSQSYTQTIMNIDGRYQEYFIDYWYDGRGSIVNKIQSFHGIEYEIKQWAGRKIGYVVVLPNEKMLSQYLRKSKIRLSKNVFFTTQKRLNRLEWHKALFTIDDTGNIFNFTDSSLSIMIFQKSHAQ